MEFSYRDSLEFVWKLKNGHWNPLATAAVVLFVMLIGTILIVLMAKGMRCRFDLSLKKRPWEMARNSTYRPTNFRQIERSCVWPESRG